MAAISWSTTFRRCSFGITTFQVYEILVKKWKHGMGPNDIITFNK